MTSFHVQGHNPKDQLNDRGGEVPSIRSFFYVGGEYVDNGAGGHVFKDQMYVEKLEPVSNSTKPYPLVFIHGQAQTGTNFLNKPDDTPSWVSRFLSEGYTVYIVDQTSRGRSPWILQTGTVAPATLPAEVIQQRFTAPKLYDLWPEAKLHTQWPGTGVMGDKIFDTFYSSNVPFIHDNTYQQSTVQAAGAALLDRINKPVIFIGHSQGSTMPLLIADSRPNLTKAIILLEPSGPPFRNAIFSTSSSRPWGLTDIAITYSPPVVDPSIDLVKQTYPAPASAAGVASSSTVPCILQAESPAPRQLVNLSPLPILVVTAEASYHVSYDCYNVDYLRQAGCSKTEHYELGKMGVHGNGHMLFLEKNSDDIQQLLSGWIEKL